MRYVVHARFGGDGGTVVASPAEFVVHLVSVQCAQVSSCLWLPKVFHPCSRVYPSLPPSPFLFCPVGRRTFVFSWGDTRGNKGYFLMTNAWFDEYLFQVNERNALSATKPFLRFTTRTVMYHVLDCRRGEGYVRRVRRPREESGMLLGFAVTTLPPPRYMSPNHTNT